MKKTLAIEELTSELLTKQIVDVFIAKVVIVSREELVVCLHGKSQIDPRYIKEKENPSLSKSLPLMARLT